MINITKQHQNQEQQTNFNQDLNNLPEHIRQIWITNKRLQKQIDILKIEIGQKDRIIHELKLEIDTNILEDTKNRLQFLRMVEEEVNQKTQQAKQEYMQKIVVFESEFQKRTKMVFSMEKQLEKEKQQNRLLTTKIKDLKEHIIVAMDQKDLIIRELTKIINSQEMNVRVQKIKRQAVEKYEIPRPHSNLEDYQYRNKKNYRNPDRDEPDGQKIKKEQQKKQKSREKSRQKQRQKGENRNNGGKQKNTKVKIRRNV